MYAEPVLSANPNVRRRTEQPFAEIDYAIYLGTTQTNDHLLGASLDSLPIHGRHSSGTAAFGNTELLLVTAPIGYLGGWLLAGLWWIVAAIGLVVSSAFAMLTNRLLRRRDVAVGVAEDNARLYDEQRQIAETLQISLLPEHLDVPDGDEIIARYWPADEANLIGGDFYDSFEIGGGRCAVAIGEPGTLLGMVEPDLVDCEFTVGAGDTLVLYTDGLTDAPGDQAVPTEELTALVSTAGDGRVEDLADAVHALTVRRHPNGADDDTALLVIRFAGRTAELAAALTSTSPVLRGEP